MLQPLSLSSPPPAVATRAGTSLPHQGLSKMQLVPDGTVYDPEYRRALPPLLEGALRGDASAVTTSRSSRRDSHGVALLSSTPNEPGAGRRRPSVINALRRTSSPAGGATGADATTPRGGEGSARPSARPSSGSGAPSAAHLVRLAHKSSAQALAVQREAAQGRVLQPHALLLATQSAPVLESARSPGFRATAAEDRMPASSPAAPLPLFDAKSLSTTLRRLPSQKRLLQQQLDAAQLAPVGDGGGDDSGWSGRAKVPAQLRAGAVRRGTGSRAAQVKQLRAVGSGWHGMPAPKPGAGWFDAQQELTSRHRSHAMAQLATGAEELTLQVRRGTESDVAGAEGEGS